MENLELDKVKFGLVREFLLELKKESGEGNEDSVKVVELKKVKQRGKIMKEFVQEFRRIAKKNGY